MGLTRMVWFRVVNDILHDVAAGLVPGTALALWLVRGGATSVVDPSTLATLARGWTWFVLVLFVALAVLVATGGVRVVYWSSTIKPEDQTSRGRSALVKHALFVALVVYAAVVGFQAIASA